MAEALKLFFDQSSEDFFQHGNVDRIPELLKRKLFVFVWDEVLWEGLQSCRLPDRQVAMLRTDDWDLDDRNKCLEAVGFLNTDAGWTGLNDALPNRFRGSTGLPFEFSFGVGEVLEVVPFLQPGIDELFIATI